MRQVLGVARFLAQQFEPVGGDAVVDKDIADVPPAVLDRYRAAPPFQNQAGVGQVSRILAQSDITSSVILARMLKQPKVT